MAELSPPAEQGGSGVLRPTPERTVDLGKAADSGPPPWDLLLVRIFLFALAGLLAGYMFMGRGFAHVGVPPLYVGEMVLLIGLIATAVAFVRLKLRTHLSPIVWLLLALMVWGLARTVPYLSTHGLDALRDAVLWGYAVFALMFYLLMDRRRLLRAMRVYGGVVPIFALWLPICYILFRVLSASIDPNEPGSNIPLIFFKSGDMSVHIVGSIAFLVLGLGAWVGARSFVWRAAIVVPLLWTAFVAGASNRGGLVAVVIGLTVVAVMALLLRRSRNWFPLLGAVGALAVVVAAPSMLSSFTELPSVTPSPTATQRSAQPTREGTEGPTKPSAPGFAASSLVPNSGFELGAPNTGFIEGWSAGEVGSYNTVAGGGYRGASFASLHATGEAESGMITSTDFPFPSGEDISVSVRVKALSGRPVLETYVHWYDRGVHLGSALASTVVTYGDKAWQEGIGYLTAPANATQVQILLRETTGGGAEVGIDEVVVEAGDFIPGFAASSLVPNSGFELGAPNTGFIEGWSAGEVGSYNTVAGGGYRGASFASLHATGEAESGMITSTDFPFPSGEDISVSVRVKALSGRPVLETYVHWYDRGVHLGSALASTVVTYGDKAWQEGIGYLTAPANATQVQILLRETTGGGAEVGIDEVVVEAGDFIPGFAASSLVPNSGFELGAPNTGFIEGWSAGEVGSYNTVAGGGYRGASFASLHATGEAESGMITSTDFPFPSGEDISVSVRVKALSGRPVLETYVHWYDRGVHLGSALASTVVTYGDKAWQEGIGYLTAPANATQVQILLRETTGGGAEVGIDEVVVEAGDFNVAPPPPPTEGRPATIEQIIENIGSVFTPSPDEGLEGTRQFRLLWWGAIVNYTVFGEYLWTGKGFGINLADADGFQANRDGSLRAPHNTHITALARMGMPGFVLWALLQTAFGMGLLRSALAHRRAGDTSVAAIGAWLLAYWTAMMVNTSFDPYIEGPQGGIWFWAVFGLGLVVMRLNPRHPET